MIDYRLLTSLATVIDEGGFERAGQVLHLTQSAVSQRVRQLEDRLGQILLIRSQPPEPTEAGRQLLRHYHQVRLLENALPAALLNETDASPLSLSLGLNADSLATWFWQAGEAFLARRGVLFNLRVDDQDVTLQMLKKGEVVGCISATSTPLQGCRCIYLGTMVYRLLARPAYIARWFPQGLTAAAVSQAPAAIFGRHDALQFRLLSKVLGPKLPPLHAHYVPSPEAFADAIYRGLAYGAIPDLQSKAWLDKGELVEVIPQQENVRLYWHCWNLSSELLNELGECLREVAKDVLVQEDF
ncbi:LysR family transcriptional regulator ArgP [Geopsychrobacter electrodiphilus]|uniref:LysR family transcriptional regulator ArgP n=1 Tax=Geopsychrobacter electrodiphilus TaxID=225196 RepID=UPI000366813B|nr:LysR family transcriptional regulator ArgP [Geopsychrobacter electrodiphilus]